jgi:TolB protein
MRRRIGLSVLVVAVLFGSLVAGGSAGTQDRRPETATASQAKAKRFDGAKQLRIRGVGGSLQNPCFSPDGSRLVVTQWKRRYNEGLADVLLIGRRSGRKLELLSDRDATSVNMPGSCWNEATDRVVYASEVDGPDSPFLVAPDGTDRRLVIRREGRIGIEPTLSPDGEWIAFQDGPYDAEGLNAIFKVRVDGTGLQQLTSGHNDTQPNWSPRGDKIVFQRQRGGRLDEEKPWDVYTIDVNGDNLVNVTRTAGRSETDVSWAPSGRFLVFSSDGPGIQVASLFAIGEDGSGRTRVTRTRGWYDGAPSWSPDGRSIAFEARRGDPDGSAGTRIHFVKAPRGMS